MNTTHKIKLLDSRKSNFKDEINLIITSPPYPMIQMWDEMFVSMNPKINLEDPIEAWKMMNNELNKVYKRAYKALKNGGIMIINIGDAYRKIGNEFRAYANISKTIELCVNIGFTYLPSIQWFKPTNSPNKFMGSGMYPIGAYVTNETEGILIFRKGIRKYSKEEVITRRESAFFWKERNNWCSNIWRDVKGQTQKINGLNRSRNGAFPLELPLRLISMYSIKGDVVWDPFGGTGTTTIAAIALQRNSIINDIDDSFVQYIKDYIQKINIKKLNLWNQKRIDDNSKIDINHKYRSIYGSVKTKQEVDIKIPLVKNIEIKDDQFLVKYDNL